MKLYSIDCNFACVCGMHHPAIFRFSSMTRLIHWLLEEHTNIETIFSIKETEEF